MKRARLWAVPSAALALLVLTGCSGITPGTASVVNGTRITNDDVDELVDAQCALRENVAKTGTGQASSTARLKQESLGLLVDVEASAQFGESEKLTPNKAIARSFFGQVEPLIKPLPAKARNEFTSVFEEWSQGRAILVQAGSAATGQQPSAENIEQLLNAGLQARNKWLKTIDIETDPRYAPDKDGLPTSGGNGSVSKATSDFAKGGAATELDAKWVASLPASQKCG